MIYPTSQNLELRKKKIEKRNKNIFLTVLFILSLFLIVTIYFISSLSGMRNEEDLAKNIAKKKGVEKNIVFKKSYRNGDYSSIEGLNNKNERVLILIDRKNKSYKVLDKNEFLDENKLNKIISKLNLKKIYNSSPSVLGDKNVMEISAVDKNNEHRFITIDLKNGKIERDLKE